MIPDQEYQRMLWAARRGMLELDLLLEPFVRERYEQLTPSGRSAVQRLLCCEDQDLFAWLLHRRVPPDQELAGIVADVISHARGDGPARSR